MKLRHHTLYCFSPPVMVVTFVFETAGAVYALWRYRLNAVTRLAALILLCLAIFQAAEFMVCRGAPNHALQMARAGFVAITLLPPLGLHLALAIAKVRHRWLTAAAYSTAACFVGFFAVVKHALQQDACFGNYVIFNLHHGAGLLFGIYYYAWLAIGIMLTWSLARTARPATRRALYGLLLGYSVFILPTATVNILSHDTLAAIPSIMCGFAVLLALVLVWIVLPKAARKRT